MSIAKWFSSIVGLAVLSGTAIFVLSACGGDEAGNPEPVARVETEKSAAGAMEAASKQSKGQKPAR